MSAEVHNPQSETPSWEADCFARTDVGGRPNNEDAFLVCDLASGDSSLPYGARRRQLVDPGLLVIVSDGMGGAEGGEIASGLAVSLIRDYLLERRAELTAAPTAEGEIPPQEPVMARAFAEANARIRQEAEQRGARGMGATATAVLVAGGRCHLAHVGDSRAYRIGGGQIEQLSEDHSLVAELVRRGELTSEQARVHPRRSVLMQSLGAVPEVRVQTRAVPLADGDLLLLCSDGVSGVLTDAQLLQVAGEASGARELCHRLVDRAKAAGTEDNVTVAACGIHLAGRGEATPVPAAGRSPAQARRSLLRRLTGWLTALACLVGLAAGCLWQGRPRPPARPFVAVLRGGKAVVVQEQAGWFGRRRERTVASPSLAETDLIPAAQTAVKAGVAFAAGKLAQDYLEQSRTVGATAPRAERKRGKPSAPVGKSQANPQDRGRTASRPIVKPAARAPKPETRNPKPEMEVER